MCVFCVRVCVCGCMRLSPDTALCVCVCVSVLTLLCFLIYCCAFLWVPVMGGSRVCLCVDVVLLCPKPCLSGCVCVLVVCILVQCMLVLFYCFLNPACRVVFVCCPCVCMLAVCCCVLNPSHPGVFVCWSFVYLSCVRVGVVLLFPKP